jgi:hypothetical protein
MQPVNAKVTGPRRKTLYFDGETARLLQERAVEEHRSESNYLQHLILQDHRTRKMPVTPFEELQDTQNSSKPQ